MPKLTALFVLITLTVAVAIPATAADKPKPLRALLITGGCCHDYKSQQKIFEIGLGARVNVKFDVFFEGGPPKGQAPTIYQNKDWAKGYDVIVHNECWGKYKDDAVIDQVVEAHRAAGAGVVTIHCAMHTFRDAKTKSWDNLLGVESRRHGPKFQIHVKINKADHPIMSTVPKNWITRNGELYHTKLLPTATALGTGSRDGSESGQQVCVWINEYKKLRVFNTTIGHHNETMLDPVYLDMLARGLLWSAGKLDANGKPMKGYEGSGDDSGLKNISGAKKQ